ncbi:MAG: shikimate dehydrogenase [Anaerolineae bacterium]|nr:shikimate dehydrogenase [Anaerolineae bacterium]
MAAIDNAASATGDARLGSPAMVFVGVTTGHSTSMRMWPAWTRILGIEGAQLVGVDLPLGAPPDAYRQVVAAILDDPQVRGALITSHKIALLDATRDLFTGLGDDARLTGEVSCIVKRNGLLYGDATDPLTSGKAMNQFIPPDHWQRTGADVLCLGAGGSAAAITLNMLRRPPSEQPRRLIVVDVEPGRLAHVRALVEMVGESALPVEYVHHTTPDQNDALLADLPAGSLVINATGMGKDRPGSPLMAHARFPAEGIVWELNYRGALDFLHQAMAQATLRQLTVADGWEYFLIGWAEIVGRVFDVPITRAAFAQLAEAAEKVRG